MIEVHQLNVYGKKVNQWGVQDSMLTVLAERDSEVFKS